MSRKRHRQIESGQGGLVSPPACVKAEEAGLIGPVGIGKARKMEFIEEIEEANRTVIHIGSGTSSTDTTKPKGDTK